MNPISEDTLVESAATAIRRAIYVSALNSNGKAKTSMSRGWWSRMAGQRNIEEAIGAARRAGDLSDVIALLRELADLDAEPGRRRLFGTRAAVIREELTVILSERFDLEVETMKEREIEV